MKMNVLIPNLFRKTVDVTVENLPLNSTCYQSQDDIEFYLFDQKHHISFTIYQEPDKRTLYYTIDDLDEVALKDDEFDYQIITRK
jgi:phage major head subunit gpT-like protein